MSTPANGPTQLPPEPWFSGRPGSVLLYRINRRPLSAPTIGAEQPDNIMDHLQEVLNFGKVISLAKRDWILGNQVISPDHISLTGQVGWHRFGERPGDRYDPETRQWQDVLEETERSARAPFAFEGSTRILGVLKHPSFREITVARVFQDLLREGEQNRDWPSTEWSVEAILDEQDFLDWLHSVQSVRKITLVARLPNPDGLEEFGVVWDEMAAKKARLLKQVMEASDENEGLAELVDDERVRAHIAMGRNGFGYVKAEGKRQGRGTSYDQREKAAREITDDLTPSWLEAAEAVLRVVKRRRLLKADRAARSEGR